MLHQRVAEGIEACGLLAIELQDMAVFHILIDTVQVVHGPRILSRGCQQVDTKREVRLVIAQMLQNGGHDVCLLGNGIHHSLSHLTAGIIEDDGRCKAADIRAVVLIARHIGMVTGNDKDGILIPRLFLSTLKEVLQRHICIAYHLVDRHLRVLFLEDVLPSGRYTERMMARQRE